MKIFFVCSGVEPGKDGVGDYTRRLAGVLKKSNISVYLVALNDRYLNVKWWKGKQKDENNFVNVIRFSNNYSWTNKIAALNRMIHEVKPDWISLQYVPYGFNRKGLPFYLPHTLNKLHNNFKWHIMFHEMWIGISPHSPFKHHFYGFFQKLIAKNLVRNLNPALITTSNLLYKIVLSKKNIETELLPLFSNIPFTSNKSFIHTIEKKYQLSFSDQSIFVTGIFGTLYPQADVPEMTEKFLQTVNKENKLYVIVFGRNSHPKELEKLRNILRDKVTLIELGELQTDEVSAIFQVLDIAVLCTPLEHTGKSGVYAALRHHGVDVLAAASDSIPPYKTLIENYNQQLKQKTPDEWSVNYIATQFLQYLEKANC